MKEITVLSATIIGGIFRTLLEGWGRRGIPRTPKNLVPSEGLDQRLK